MGERPMQRVAIAGLGVIGWRVAEALNRGIEPFALTAVSANDRQKAESRLRARGIAVPVLAIDELEPRADMVIECVPAQLFRQVAEPFLKNGKTVMTLSCGALLANEDLVDLARKRGGQIVVPTGALIGLDAVTAAAEGFVLPKSSVTFTTNGFSPIANGTTADQCANPSVDVALTPLTRTLTREWASCAVPRTWICVPSL